jgi:hypothetical protein
MPKKVTPTPTILSSNSIPGYLPREKKDLLINDTNLLSPLRVNIWGDLLSPLLQTGQGQISLDTLWFMHMEGQKEVKY